MDGTQIRVLAEQIQRVVDATTLTGPQAATELEATIGEMGFGIEEAADSIIDRLANPPKPERQVMVSYHDESGIPRAYAWGPVTKRLEVEAEAKRQLVAYIASKPNETRPYIDQFHQEVTVMPFKPTSDPIE